jgi:hypothetical protein
MKHTLLVLTAAVSLGFSGNAFAQSAGVGVNANTAAGNARLGTDAGVNTSVLPAQSGMSGDASTYGGMGGGGTGPGYGPSGPANHVSPGVGAGTGAAADTNK